MLLILGGTGQTNTTAWRCESPTFGMAWVRPVVVVVVVAAAAAAAATAAAAGGGGGGGGVVVVVVIILVVVCCSLLFMVVVVPKASVLPVVLCASAEQRSHGLLPHLFRIRLRDASAARHICASRVSTRDASREVLTLDLSDHTRYIEIEEDNVLAPTGEIFPRSVLAGEC